MSTYSTLDTEVAAAAYDAGCLRVLRVSVDLAGGHVGLDVETPDELAYDRSVLTPADARAYAELIIRAATQAERIHHR